MRNTPCKALQVILNMEKQGEGSFIKEKNEPFKQNTTTWDAYEHYGNSKKKNIRLRGIIWINQLYLLEVWMSSTAVYPRAFNTEIER